MKRPVDALGNEIVENNLYGYSSPGSGRHRVVIGRAIGGTEKKVRLEVLTVKEFLYGKPEKPWRDHAKSLSIAGYLLFPVDPSKTGAL
jgi:hypothetical protein